MEETVAYLKVFGGGSEDNSGNVSHDSCCPAWNHNQVLSKYKAG